MPNSIARKVNQNIQFARQLLSVEPSILNEQVIAHSALLMLERAFICFAIEASLNRAKPPLSKDVPTYYGAVKLLQQSAYPSEIKHLLDSTESWLQEMLFAFDNALNLQNSEMIKSGFFESDLVQPTLIASTAKTSSGEFAKVEDVRLWLEAFTLLVGRHRAQSEEY